MNILNLALHLSNGDQREQNIRSPSLPLQILLSATCIGNDGTSCPLFHGSLAPMIFSQLIHDFWSPLQLALIQSNNITWAHHLHLPRNSQDCEKIMQALSKTRYFSRSVKSLTMNSEQLSDKSVVMFLCAFCSGIVSFDVSDTSSLDDDAVEVISSFKQIRHLNLDFSQITNVGLGYICSSLKNLRKLNLSACSRLTNEGIKLLVKLPQLDTLDLTSLSQLINDNGFEIISRISTLRVLILSFCDLTDNDLGFISNLPHITHLNINCCCRITNNGIAHLAKLTSLRELKMLSLDLVDTKEALKHLVRLPYLDPEKCILVDGKHEEAAEIIESFFEELVSNQCQEKFITSSDVVDQNEKIPIRLTGLQQLVKLKVLQKYFPDRRLVTNLLVERNFSTDEIVAKICDSFPHLRVFNLLFCQYLTDESLRSIGEAKFNKTIISLNLNIAWCRKVSDEGIEHLSKLTSLQILKISSPFLGRGAKAICQLPSLHTLALPGVAVGDAFIETQLFPGLPTLRHLALSSSKVTDAGLKSLQGLTSLKHLDVSLCAGVTNAGILHLLRITSLRELKLENCSKVDDEAVDILCQMIWLEKLYLKGTNILSDEVIKRLKTSLTNCFIFVKD
jgi:F-box and leucine-rich repeat protein 14